MAIFGIYVRFLGGISFILVWPSDSLNAIMPSCLGIYPIMDPWDDCIFTYMNGSFFMVNVGKYTIHGCYGYIYSFFSGVYDVVRFISVTSIKNQDSMNDCNRACRMPQYWPTHLFGGFLRGGVFKGRGSLGNPKDSQKRLGNLGKIRGITTPPLRILLIILIFMSWRMAIICIFAHHPPARQKDSRTASDTKLIINIIILF